jgi:hypothetical protein
MAVCINQLFTLFTKKEDFPYSVYEFSFSLLSGSLPTSASTGRPSNMGSPGVGLDVRTFERFSSLHLKKSSLRTSSRVSFIPLSECCTYGFHGVLIERNALLILANVLLAEKEGRKPQNWCLMVFSKQSRSSS